MQTGHLVALLPAGRMLPLCLLLGGWLVLLPRGRLLLLLLLLVVVVVVLLLLLLVVLLLLLLLLLVVVKLLLLPRRRQLETSLLSLQADRALLCSTARLELLPQGPQLRAVWVHCGGHRC